MIIWMQLQHDTHDPVRSSLKLTFMKRRGKVVDIVCNDTLVFVVTRRGVCTAWSRLTDERVCHMNIAPDDMVRNIFWCEHNKTLIIVSTVR
jgi:hypothetical protein